MGERKRDRGRRRVREQEKPVEQHPAEETRQSFSGFNAVLDFLVFRQHWGGGGGERRGENNGSRGKGQGHSESVIGCTKK